MNLTIQAGEGLLNCAQDTDLLLIGGVRHLTRYHSFHDNNTQLYSLTLNQISSLSSLLNNY
eukprot:SAG22_NODE_504_length_9692_cov_366.074325_2_plen_61_part_00